MSKSKNTLTLKYKIAQALSDDLKKLSGEMKEILVDDLACAFESRLKVLSTAEASMKF